MLSFKILAYGFVWASLTQRIVAEGPNSYDAWKNPRGGYQNGWSSRSFWSTVTAVAPSNSPVGSSTTTWSSIATSVPYPATNSSVSGSSVSPSKTGTALTSHASSTTGNTVTYDWNIEWMIAAPDGIARPVIGVNGQWYVHLPTQS
jgi:iron transport multicopper oxidase